MELDAPLTALHTSSDRLADIVGGFDDDALTASAYPSEWSIADTLSHLGSGAVIMRRRLDDVVAGRDTPDDFAPSVWDEWNAKSPRDQADDALVADRELVARIDALTPDEAANFHASFGPLEVDAAQFVGMRLNEHALHTWDVEVPSHPDAVVPTDVVGVVVDGLGMIARFTGKPTGDTRTITIGTVDPARTFTLELEPEQATFGPGDSAGSPDITLPAEALVRLVYGRLDADHTPELEGDASLLDVLRAVYPGP